MRRLWAYLQRHRGRWAWGVVLLLLTNATTMAIPQLFRLGVDGINQGAGYAYLRDLALVLMLIAVGGGIFRVGSRVHIFFVARDVEMDLRCDFYRHLTGQSAGFFGAHPTGDLMSRATSDLSQVRLMLGPGSLNMVNTVVAYASAIPLMVMISPKLTALSLAVYPPSIFAMRALAKALYRRNLRQQQEMGLMSSLVQENLAGAHVVRAFGLEGEQSDRFRERNDSYYDAAVKLAWTRSVMWRFVMVLASMGSLVTVYFGAREVLDGKISLGELVALVEYMALLSWPTFALGWLLSMWQRGAAAMERIDGIMNVQPHITSGDVVPEELEGSVKVDHLTVGYGEGKPVLEDVDVEVEPGRTLGIVGPVGSGKTTLLRALMRLTEVPEGHVFIGGHDVRELDLDALRGSFAYVAQDPMLFSKSLADNVAFGSPSASGEKVMEALELAALGSDLQALPKGVETPVGERGITLSGGQKQRTAIARALLLDAPILVLDDALSSVDAETETQILEGLRGARQGRTTLIVAHRVTAVTDADEIIVLDEGRIVERGTHEELIAVDGLYARMARQQELEGARMDASMEATG